MAEDLAEDPQAPRPGDDPFAAPDEGDGTEPSVRARYEAHGVEAYYKSFGRDYRNPHEPQVRRALTEARRVWGLDLSCVLDLAAGSGEVTVALREMGAGRVDGIDPYTFEAYEARTGRPGERLSFEDVAAGALAGRAYTLVVCSYALHLCEPSRLPAVAQQLSFVAPALLVLTPHKRPEVRAEWGWEPAGESVVERVRSRLYRSRSCGVME